MFAHTCIQSSVFIYGGIWIWTHNHAYNQTDRHTLIHALFYHSRTKSLIQLNQNKTLCTAVPYCAAMQQKSEVCHHSTALISFSFAKSICQMHQAYLQSSKSTNQNHQERRTERARKREKKKRNVKILDPCFGFTHKKNQNICVAHCISKNHYLDCFSKH